MSTIKAINIQHPSSPSTNIVMDANGNMTVAGTVSGGTPMSGMRNRIINGDMRIDQRNAGTSQTVSSSGIYSVDRWLTGYVGTGSKYSIQQNAGSVTPPPGFTSYLGVTSLSAFTAATGDIYHFQQRIEGYNASDLAYGTSSAKTVTVSFWARSSLTGTFNIQIFNPNGTQVRSYVSTYTINSANTWEYKTITIPGDTSYAVADTSNGLALILCFTFDGGATTYTTNTTNSWINGNYLRASGTTNLLATNGATFYITGVQLEQGTIATPFERRPFGAELALCQRYYEKSYSLGIKPGTTIDGGQASFFLARDTFRCFGGTFYKVNKRSSPTVTIYSAYGVVGKTTAYEAPGDTGSGAFARRHEEYQINEIGDSSNPFTAGNYYWAAWTSSAEL